MTTLKASWVLNQAKISSLVSGNRPGEKKNYHSPARLVDCVSKYTFLISENNKQTKQNKNQEKQKKLKKREYLRKID